MKKKLCLVLTVVLLGSLLLLSCSKEPEYNKVLKGSWHGTALSTASGGYTDLPADLQKELTLNVTADGWEYKIQTNTYNGTWEYDHDISLDSVGTAYVYKFNWSDGSKSDAVYVVSEEYLFFYIGNIGSDNYVVFERD